MKDPEKVLLTVQHDLKQIIARMSKQVGLLKGKGM